MQKNIEYLGAARSFFLFCLGDEDGLVFVNSTYLPTVVYIMYCVLRIVFILACFRFRYSLFLFFIYREVRSSMIRGRVLYYFDRLFRWTGDRGS
jgi:hypothetical protein